MARSCTRIHGQVHLWTTHTHPPGCISFALPKSASLTQFCAPSSTFRAAMSKCTYLHNATQVQRACGTKTRGWHQDTWVCNFLQCGVWLSAFSMVYFFDWRYSWVEIQNFGSWNVHLPNKQENKGFTTQSSAVASQVLCHKLCRMLCHKLYKILCHGMRSKTRDFICRVCAPNAHRHHFRLDYSVQ